MKFFYCFLLLIPLNLLAQWNHSSTTNQRPINKTHLWATNESTLHLATDLYALKSRDGGISWEKQKLPGIESDIGTVIRSIYFKSEQEGYIVGGVNLSQFCIWKTQDGGESWVLELFPKEAIIGNFRAIQFVNSDTGYIVGDEGTIFKTIDGGEGWQELTIDGLGNEDLAAVHFLDENNGIVLTAKFGGYKTQDGGLTWEFQDNPLTGFETGIRFFNEQDGVGWSNRVGVHTTKNGGATWEENATHLGFIESFWAFDAQQWIVGTAKGKTYKTIDGGQNWAVQKQVINRTVDDFFFYNENLGWASTLGPRVNILSTKNAGGIAVNGNLEKEGECTGDSLYFSSHVIGTTDFSWLLDGQVYSTAPNFVFVPQSKREYIFTVVAETGNQQIEQTIEYTPKYDPLNKNLRVEVAFDTICLKDNVRIELAKPKGSTTHRIAMNGVLLPEEMKWSGGSINWTSPELDKTTNFTIYTEHFSCGLVEQNSKKVTVVTPPKTDLNLSYKTPVCVRDTASIIIENPEVNVVYQAFSEEVAQSAIVRAQNDLPHTVAIPNILTKKSFVVQASKSAGCALKLKDTISINPIQLAPTFAIPSLNVPINQMIEIKNTSSDTLTYDWQMSNGVTSSNRHPSPISFAEEGNADILLEVTSPFGCKEKKVLNLTTYDPTNLSEEWISKHGTFPDFWKYGAYQMNIDGAENMYYVVNKYQGINYTLNTQAGKGFNFDANNRYIIKNDKYGVMQWGNKIAVTPNATYSVSNVSFTPQHDLVIMFSYQGEILLNSTDGQVYRTPNNKGLLIAYFSPNGILKCTQLIESYNITGKTLQIDETGAVYLAGTIGVHQDQPEFYHTDFAGNQFVYEAKDIIPMSESYHGQFIAKIDNLGELVWIKPYRLSFFHSPIGFAFTINNIKPDKAGGLYIWSSGVGNRGSRRLHQAVALTRINDKGEVLWNTFGKTEEHEEYMLANFLEVDHAGNAIIAGSVDGTHTIGDQSPVQTITGHYISKVSKTGKTEWTRYIQSTPWLPNINKITNFAWGLSLDKERIYLRSAVSEQFNTFPTCNPSEEVNFLVSTWDLAGNALDFMPILNHSWSSVKYTSRPQTFEVKNNHLYLMGYTQEQTSGKIGELSIPNNALGNTYAARIVDDKDYLPYITRPLDNVSQCHLKFCEQNPQTLEVSSLFKDIQWFVDDQPISGAITPTILPKISGNYKVSAINPAGNRVTTPNPTSVDIHLAKEIKIKQVEDYLTTSTVLDFYIWRDATTHQIVKAGNEENAGKFYPEKLGDYYLSGDLWGYCVEQSANYTYAGIISSSHDDLIYIPELQVFPNPSSGMIYLKFETPIREDFWQIRIFDMLQNEITSVEISGKSKEINFQFDGSHLPSGIYSIQLESVSKKQRVAKNIILTE